VSYTPAIDRDFVDPVQAGSPVGLSGTAESTAKRIAISVLLGALVVAFLAVLGLGVLHETGGTNSYAALADSWLHGRLDSDGCFQSDCAYFGGRSFIIFPPLPAVIALPFVALFGSGFHGFLPLAVLALAASGVLWWRIAARLTGARDLTMLLVLVVLFATPLFFVTLRSDHVWFLAQSFGFLFTSAALYCALMSRNTLLAGLFIAASFLCRQMTILYLPFLYVLLLDEEPLFRIDGAAVKRLLALAAFPLVAIAAYMAYNYARFSAPMETGYSYLYNDPGHVSQFIAHRVLELGLFSPHYLLFNVVYMFLAGPHVEFTGRYMTEFAGFDTNGASLFLVTPLLLVAFLARWERSFWFGLATCAVILGLTLLYHSNGYSQYSAQRYALDWLPILLIFVARGMKPAYAGPLAVLTVYAMAVTLGMIVVGGVVGGVAAG
jgi:hypothetical protein